MESQARHPSTVSERAERDLASIGPAIRFGAAVAGQYDAGRALPAEVMEALHWQIVDAAGLAPGAAVVDVGAGTGALAGPFLRDSFSYVGLDASGAMLRQFHAAYHRALQAVPQVVQADLLALPLQDSSFDLVLAFRVFGVVRGWRRGIRECLRVLRTGGHLIAGRVERGPGSLHEIVRSERNRLLEQAGSQTRRPGGDDSAVV
ncbi:MAG TPA: class I SAM-dependent methyltransferase, partial [Dehalococcoidia bacterium]|nr:class I SAM-dependent methyltransferase [Dehalococcoidia bacterium]